LVRSEIELWDIELEKKIAALPPAKNTGGTQKFAYSPDGRYLAVDPNFEGRADNKFELWDLEQQKLLKTLDHPGISMRQFIFRQDGKRLAVLAGSFIAFYDLE
jgi:WD40 repeat protein